MRWRLVFLASTTLDTAGGDQMRSHQQPMLEHSRRGPRGMRRFGGWVEASFWLIIYKKSGSSPRFN